MLRKHKHLLIFFLKFIITYLKYWTGNSLLPSYRHLKFNEMEQ